MDRSQESGDAMSEIKVEVVPPPSGWTFNIYREYEDGKGHGWSLTESEARELFERLLPHFTPSHHGCGCGTCQGAQKENARLRRGIEKILSRVDCGPYRSLVLRTMCDRLLNGEDIA